MSTGAIAVPMAQVVRGATTIHYERQGSGTPVLLIPGALGGARATWGELPDQLSKHALVIAPDLRGFGKSSAVKRYSLASIPGDLSAILEDTKIPAVHVVAFGDGAVAALHFALERPERVLSLALVSGRAFVSDEDLAILAERRDRADGEWWDTYRFDRAYLDARHDLHKVTVQTLLVHGEDDAWSGSRHADILSGGLPHARSFVIGNAGYRVHETREFATLLAAFLHDRGVIAEDVELPVIKGTAPARTVPGAPAAAENGTNPAGDIDFVL